MRGPRDRKRRHVPAAAACVAATVAIAAAMQDVGERSRHALSDFRRGDTVPAFSSTAIDGRSVDPARLGGRCALIVFAQTPHARTASFLAAAGEALADPALEDIELSLVLALSRGSAPDAVDPPAVPPGSPPPAIVHDAERTLFGAFRVSVVPSAVVLDPQGGIVHVMPGAPPNAKAVLVAAIRLGAQRIDAEGFERTLRPATPDLGEPEQLRASRHAQLGRRLEQRGMDEGARAEYASVLEIDPSSTPALLGLGRLALRRDDLEDAESRFTAVIALDPGSIDATVGLATVQIRGGDRIEEGERLARSVLARQPSNPQANYLMGLVHESRGEFEAAAQAYRRATESLLGS